VQEALSIYRDQLEKAKSALINIQSEAEAASEHRTEQQALVERIEIAKPLFSLHRDSMMRHPVISFTIANRGSVPVRRIFVEGTLQTPGRAVAWVKDTFNYEFPGGLEPNETQYLNLEPNMFSDWGKVPETAVDGSLLTLRLTSFEDAAGNRYGEDDSGNRDSERLANRKKALEDAIRELETKIGDLEKQLQQEL
jgi:hypothetical protein